METSQLVRQFAPNTRIVHHIAGRIRLKLMPGGFPDGMVPPDYPERMRAALESIPGINGIRFNLLARSCTVEYDPATIPHDAFPDLIARRDSAAAQVLLDALKARQTELSGC